MQNTGCNVQLQPLAVSALAGHSQINLAICAKAHCKTNAYILQNCTTCCLALPIGAPGSPTSFLRTGFAGKPC